MVLKPALPFRTFSWFVILAFLLPACKSVAEAPPPPTPITLRLSYTAALHPWVERIAACADKQPEIALFLDELPFDQSNLSLHDAALRLGGVSGSNEYAVVLGYDELKVIVNELNPVQVIDETAFENLFNGSLPTWETLSPSKAVYVVSVQSWIYLPESELSQPEIIGNRFDYKKARKARLASTPDQVIQGIKDDPGGIGYVPVSWLNGELEGIKTLDMPIDQELPVLAVSQSEPQGSLRNLLACVSQARN